MKNFLLILFCLMELKTLAGDGIIGNKYYQVFHDKQTNTIRIAESSGKELVTIKNLIRELRQPGSESVIRMNSSIAYLNFIPHQSEGELFEWVDSTAFYKTQIHVNCDSSEVIRFT